MGRRAHAASMKMLVLVALLVGGCRTMFTSSQERAVITAERQREREQQAERERSAARREADRRARAEKLQADAESACLAPDKGPELTAACVQMANDREQRADRERERGMREHEATLQRQEAELGRKQRRADNFNRAMEQNNANQRAYQQRVQQQILSPPPAPRNCTSRTVGDTVHTNCY